MSPVIVTPPVRAAASLKALVKALCAPALTKSPAWKTPEIEAGATNPVMLVPGDTPTSPLARVLVPGTLVMVEPARATWLDAAPSCTIAGTGGKGTGVLAISRLPRDST